MFKRTLIAAMLTASMSASAVEMNIGSGGEGGFYEGTMKNIAAKANAAYKGKEPITFNVENTNGSVENIVGLSDGDYDLIIAQADCLKNGRAMPPSAAIYNAHKEAVYFLINKDVHKDDGIDDLEDIEGSDKYRMAVVEDSGALCTLKAFVGEDSGYKTNLDNAIYFDDMYDAAEAVANGATTVNGKTVPVAAMLYVSRVGSISGQIVEDFGTQLVIGEATDGDFNDAEDLNGKDLFENCSIPKSARQGMAGATIGDQDTVCVRAQVVFNIEWTQNFENKKDRKKAKKAVKRAINRTLKATR